MNIEIVWIRIRIRIRIQTLHNPNRQHERTVNT